MNNNSNSAPEKEITGIKCDVFNCEYHHEGNKCYAGCIEVGNGNCKNNKDTACNTFKAKF